VHSASTGLLSLFTVAAALGLAAIKAAGVLPVFAGIAVHDGFTPRTAVTMPHTSFATPTTYVSWTACWSPDPDRQAWAAQMIRLLCEINDLARYAREKGIHAIGSGQLDFYRRRYHDILTGAKATNHHPGGNQAKSPAVNLIARLSGFADDVLRFAHDLRVKRSDSGRAFDVPPVCGGVRLVDLACLTVWKGHHAKELSTGVPAQGSRSIEGWPQGRADR
jgi:transposase